MAHILAQAVMEIRDEVKLGFGPPVAHGFYYDFDLKQPLSPEDLPVLEKKMKQIIKQKQRFERLELSYEELVERLHTSNQHYKIEFAEELQSKGEGVWSIYENGKFWDMCEGPHVDNSGEIPLGSFCLDSLAGAYWRGDETKPMMQRVYGLAFETPQELEDYKKQRKLAMERDHRRLNKQHHYYVIEDEVGKGLPLWMPNGTVIREELEKLAKEMEFQAGYDRVATPHISRDSLYHTSGHLPYYKDSMFPPMEIDGETFYLKPMNCPHHHLIYRAQPRSYRDLPLRLAEYGTCYRYEQSGELAGLLRVRGLTMNDAHIYCTPEQAADEFINVLRMHTTYYDMFQLSNYWIRLSLPAQDNKKYVDDAENWAIAVKVVTDAMNQLDIPHEAVEGEAAFYGPKIDFQVSNVVGREETASTNQLDLIMSKRFNLIYKGADNNDYHPFIIHRAPLGTHERFCSFLIEHYGGAFPTWLAPMQVRLVPVAPAFNEYAKKLAASLKRGFVRVEVDDSADSFSKKIRNSATSKIPNVLIIGEKEQLNQEVTWKRYGSKDQTTLKFEAFRDELSREILTRTDWRVAGQAVC